MRPLFGVQVLEHLAALRIYGYASETIGPGCMAFGKRHQTQGVAVGAVSKMIRS